MSRRGRSRSSVGLDRCAHCRPVVSSSTWAPPDVIPTVRVTGLAPQIGLFCLPTDSPRTLPLRRSSLILRFSPTGQQRSTSAAPWSARGCTPTEQAKRKPIPTGPSKPAQSAHSLERPFQHPPPKRTGTATEVGGCPTGPDTVRTGRDEQAGIGRLHPATTGSNSPVRDITIR